MTTRRPIPTVPPRRLNRRQITLGLGAAGLGAIFGAQGIKLGTLAASGQLPGANLAEMATYGGWRTTWDLIVPLSTDGLFPLSFLLYDRTAGQAAFIAVDAFGGYREVRTYTDWRTTWDALVPFGVPGSSGVSGVFAYDRMAGQVTTFQFDVSGNAKVLRNYTNWRKTWTAFAPYGTSGLLAYERSGGYVTLFTLDQSGAPLVQRSYNDWRPTWDLLTNGPFTTTDPPGREVLLYDRAAQQAEGFTIDTNGEIALFATYSGWRQTWTSMQGGRFLFRGYSGSLTADLLLFDQNAQELEFVDIGAGNTLTSILLTPTPDVHSWTHVAAIGPDLLLFYDRPTGAAAFYATGRAPLPVPTVTPTATPTPAPVIIPDPTAIPTPTVIPTGRVTVRLEQGRGNEWDTYTGKSDDPASGAIRNGYIIGVKNTSKSRIALIHRDRPDTRTGPVFVKSSDVSDDFNGMEVAGDWEAKVSGRESDAPRDITIEVRYEIR